MSSADLLEVTGTVTAAHAGRRFTVRLETGHEVSAHLSGRVAYNNIKIVCGDRVRVGLSPYDLTHGRISYRE